MRRRAGWALENSLGWFRDTLCCDTALCNEAGPMKSILLFCTRSFHLFYCYTACQSLFLACRKLLADVHVVTTLDDVDIHAHLDE